jgi:hypothetical protein
MIYDWSPAFVAFMPRLFAFVLVGVASHPARAQSLNRPTEATIVYDSRMREFRCWSEGPLTKERRETAANCSVESGWHPITAALYFTRGELVSVLVVHGVVNDLFSVDLTVDALTAPTTPVSGSIADLPKLQAIPPLATIFAGVKATTVAGCAPQDPMLVLGLVPAATKQDFKTALDAIVTPFSTTEVTNLLATDLDGAVNLLAGATTYTAIADQIRTRIHEIATPTTFEDWIIRSKSLSIQIDQAASLRTRIVAGGLPSAIKTINDATLASAVSNVDCARKIDPQKLQTLTSLLAEAFANHAHALVDSTTVDGNGRFIAPPPNAGMQKLLDAIGKAHDHTTGVKELPTLKANLHALVDNVPVIKDALDRSGRLARRFGSLTAGQNLVTQLGGALAPLVDTLIARATSIDSVGRTLSLPSGYDILPLGQWFANQILTVTIKQGTRLQQFDIGAVSDATRLVIGGDQPSAKTTSTTVVDLAAARTLKFPIYDTYHVKLGLGFAYSTVRDDRFQVDSVKTGTGDAAVTRQFIDQTRARARTLLATATVMVFPFARDEFPWRPRYSGEKEGCFYKDLALTLGVGLTSPIRDYFVGGTWMRPTSPIGVQAAWHIGVRDYPPIGVQVGTPLDQTTRVFTMHQKALNGFSAGLVFSTDFFTKTVGTIFKAGT